MKFQEKLPVSYLIFTYHGRINRLTYWTATLFVWTTFYVLFQLLSATLSYTATLILYPLLFITLSALSVKRLHDTGLSGWWLLLPEAKTIFTQPISSRPGYQRIVLATPVPQLHKTLLHCAHDHLFIEHIFDF